MSEHIQARQSKQLTVFLWTPHFSGYTVYYHWTSTILAISITRLHNCNNSVAVEPCPVDYISWVFFYQVKEKWIDVLQKTCIWPLFFIHHQLFIPTPQCHSVNDSRWYQWFWYQQGNYKSFESRPLIPVSWHFRVKHQLTAVNMATLFTTVAMLAVLSSGLCEEKTFLQRAGVAFNSRQYRSLLTVSNGEQFGKWTWPEMCPENFFAVGFSIRVKTLTLSCIINILFNINPLRQVGLYNLANKQVHCLVKKKQWKQFFRFGKQPSSVSLQSL